MAKATVAPPLQERVISLELTEREAAVLYYLVGWKVLGPTDGPRGEATAIYDALSEFDLSVVAVKAACRDGGSVNFNSYPEGFK